MRGAAKPHGNRRSMLLGEGRVIILTIYPDDVANGWQKQNLRPGLLILFFFFFFFKWQRAVLTSHGFSRSLPNLPTGFWVWGTLSRDRSLLHPWLHWAVSIPQWSHGAATDPSPFCSVSSDRRIPSYITPGGSGGPARAGKKILELHLYFHLPQKEVNFTNV